MFQKIIKDKKYFHRPQTKLRQGNVFIGVCLSTFGERWVDPNIHTWAGGVSQHAFSRAERKGMYPCMYLDRWFLSKHSLGQGGWPDRMCVFVCDRLNQKQPPKWAVSILLEYIVSMYV